MLCPVCYVLKKACVCIVGDGLRDVPLPRKRQSVIAERVVEDADPYKYAF